MSVLAAVLTFAHRVAVPGLVRLAPWLLAGAVGALAFNYAPVIGVKAQLVRLSNDRDNWRSSAEDYQRAAAGWERSFRAAEAVRAKEGRAALVAQAETAKQCDARVASARQSAIAIERIVTKEPVYDSSRCPVRSVVAADLLRDALAPRP